VAVKLTVLSALPEATTCGLRSSTVVEESSYNAKAIIDQSMDPDIVNMHHGLSEV
jgi:hypothetical protein